MSKMMEGCLSWSHPALANVPSVKWVILTNNGVECYQTFEDALGDLPYRKSINKFATIAKAVRAEAMVASGHF